MLCEALCVGLLVAMAMPSCSACDEVIGNPALAQKIEDQVQNWVKYYNAGDIDEDERIFTDDATLMENGHKNATGHDAIRKLLQQDSQGDQGNEFNVKCVEITIFGDGYGLMITTNNKPGRTMSLWKFENGVPRGHRVMRNLV